MCNFDKFLVFPTCYFTILRGVQSINKRRWWGTREFTKTNPFFGNFPIKLLPDFLKLRAIPVRMNPCNFKRITKR